MSEAGFQPSRLSDPQDEEVISYRSVCGMAVAGAAVGLLAPMAMVHPFFWIVPPAGIVLCVLALRRISREAPALIGRKAAVVGLIASVLGAAAVPSQWLAYRWFADREARHFAAFWFEFLGKGETDKAHQLGEPPQSRSPLDKNLAKYYIPGSESGGQLEHFESLPEVKTLVALGDRAQVRYYDTQNQWSSHGKDLVEQVYAVTYEEGGRRQSFFLLLVLERSRLAPDGPAYWRVSHHEGGIRPEAMGGTSPFDEG
ncbi:MAG: DUF4190 domain-containing protein [Planctomycetota bacterium]|jgi:hypothetical protein